MKRMYRTLVFALAIGSLYVVTGHPSSVSAHCQVPCGIYDDGARIKAMLEDVTTIDKAVAEINSHSDSHAALDVNQVVRWVNTKEEHASKIIETVSLYFLTQKVKPVAASEAGYQDYLKTLADHHAVMRAAMKTKQTVDPAAVNELKEAVMTMAKHYATP